ncbi:MAG: DNA (cytosine-5-)-methyltransferase [Candidatus Magasanikbacteria bacterium]|jgi:DNA (cytosine-5)-methyltransferase 1
MGKNNKKNKFKVIDLFAGIGGMRMGFEKAGFQVVYSNDLDPNACKTYRANFGDIDQNDIKNINTDIIPDFDILLGGFPCQPFSMIGKRKGLNDDRAKAFFHIIRILAAKQPRAFVLENVKHLRLYDKGKVYERLKQNLEWAGYRVKEAVLDSKNFGVPQHRERLYIVGFLDHSIDFEFPKPHCKPVALSDILEKDIDEFYYLSQKYYKGLLKHKKRHEKKGSGFGCQILDVGGISNTLVAGNMGRERNLIKDRPVKKNKFGIRRMTVKECARLQGFPEKYKWPVSITRAYQQLGNAVTVNVAAAVAKKVRKILETGANH